jgi:hypothetical protein
MRMAQLRLKYPFEYEVTPEVIDKGISWLTFKLKNIGRDTLTGLDIQLHSRDTYYLTVYGTGSFGAGYYLSDLESNQERELPFRVTALGSADVYATITGRKGGDLFWWESGWTSIMISEEKAEIGRLLVQSNPYTTIGKTISVEATVKGLREGTGLELKFWVESPSGKSEEQVSMDIKDLPVGEEARYSVEFTTKEAGYYRVYAYLYDGWRSIGYKTETIYVQGQ